MITPYINIILYITGGLTAAMIFQFLLPKLMLEKVNEVKITSPAGMFYARHWGLTVFSVGALLVYAGYQPIYREPIILAATIEKVGLILLLMADFKKPYTKKLKLAMYFDMVCVTLYILYLLKV
ncbi:hypothetical protein BKI52_37930 [marine bacterium AO1-C]|nr:hypothetical protein BKI52_37930 [marine bacterium AO1-C]